MHVPECLNFLRVQLMGAGLNSIRIPANAVRGWNVLDSTALKADKAII